jgi:uncharacterized repeat protein (TIGR01451 family)
MFFQRLLGRTRKPRPQVRQVRRLKLEKLLSRELMAADFGAIGGTVYSDLDGDGILIGEPTISGAVINLFRDTNGNGTFDPGTDANIQTANSGLNGEYLFDRLTEGTYFVQQIAVTGQLQRPGDELITVDITETLARGDASSGQQSIDTFDGVLQQASDPAAGLVTPTTSALAPDAVGGERDIALTRTSGVGSISVEVNGVEPGVLAFESSLTGAGTARVQWDGTDADAVMLNPVGLQTAGVGLDFTAGGAEGVLVEIGSDQPGNTVIITLYTDAGNFSSVTVNIPDLSAVADVTEPFTVPFTDFTIGAGAGVDFTDVGAIQADITIGNSSDIILNVVGAIAPGLVELDLANSIPVTLGNLVFNDANNNGLFDGTETGINGVSVILYEDSNGSGLFESGTDVQIGTAATTAGGGLYQFTNLFPGDYIVQIPQNQFPLGAVLAGFTSSLGNTAAPDPDNNVDSDDNGTPLTGQGIVSGAITLVSQAEPTNDGDADNNTNLSLDFGVTPQVDVSIEKTVLSIAPVAGQNATYRLTVENAAGLSAASNVVVTDTLPPNVTLVSVTRDSVDITGTTVVTGNTTTGLILTLPASTLASGGTQIIDVTVAVPASGTGAFNNVANVTSNGLDIDTGNNDSDVDLNPTRVVDLELDKTVSSANVAVGDSFFYTITVTNNGGPSTATGVTVTDVLPAGITFVSGSINRSGVITTNDVTAIGQNVTGAVGDLAVGASAIITVNVTAGTVAIGTVTNDASVTGTETESDPGDNRDTVDVTVSAIVDLVLDKQSPTSATAGGQLTYTIDVTNNGPATATGVSILDELPAGTTFASGTGGTFDATTPGQVTIGVNNILPGATATVTMTVNLASNLAATTLTNRATVSSNEIELVATQGNETDSVQTPIVASVDLSVTKVGQANSVVPGNQFSYTITVDNLGLSDATNAVLDDNLPTGLTLVSITENGTNITNAATVNGQLVTLPLGTIAPADPVRTFTYLVNVASSVSTDISNAATVSSSQQANEVNTVNNTSTVLTTVTPNASLTIVKSDDVDPATPGSTVTYTISVQNTGPSDARNVVVADTLPAGVTVTTSSAPGGAGTLSGGTLTLNFGTVPAGQTRTASVTVLIPGTTRGTLTNSATVSGTGVTGGTLTDVETTALAPQFDVTVTQSASPATAAAGSTVTFTSVVTNASNSVSTASGVLVTNTLPAGVTFSSASLNGNPLSSISNIAIPDLAPGASATIQVLGTVNAGVANGQVLSNVASITTAPNETNVLTNTSNAAVTVDLATAEISGRVVVDSNFNGLIDASELAAMGGGIQNATVTLRIAGSPDVTTTTDANGNYSFQNLLPGNYTVLTALPAQNAAGQNINLTPVVAVPSAAGDTATGASQINVGLASDERATLNNFAAQFPFSKWIFFA